MAKAYASPSLLLKRRQITLHSETLVLQGFQPRLKLLNVSQLRIFFRWLGVGLESFASQLCQCDLVDLGELLKPQMLLACLQKDSASLGVNVAVSPYS